MPKHLFQFLLYSCFILLFAAVLDSCKKDPPLSSEKIITSFYFKTADNSGIILNDVAGRIINDTIFVKVPIGTAVANLVPAISFKGSAVNPASKVSQNFTNTVVYTVTAEDGSTKNYKVIVSYLSDAKAITSFMLQASDNSSLSADITGTIGTDTILLAMPPGIALNTLVPAIIYTGVSVAPANKASQDFSEPITYIVTAEDGSTKEYIVIASANATVYAGSADGNVYALEAATGRVIWKYDAGAAVTGNTYSNGVVYACSNNGHVYALDAVTGGVKWDFYEGADAAFSIPSIHYGMVYFYLGNTTGNYIYALDTLSGTVTWKNFAGRGIGALKPAVADGKICYCADDGIYSFDAMSGQFLWHYAAGLTFVNPAVADAKIYAGTEGTVLTSVEEATGALKWYYIDPNFPVSVSSSATIYKGVAFTGATHALYAVNVTDGLLKWRYSNVGLNYFTSPVAANDLLYTTSSDKKLYAFNVNTGVVIWSTANPANNPVAANEDIFSGGLNNSLYMLDGKKGNIKWLFQAAGAITSDPCIVDNAGNIFYSGDSGDEN